MPLSHDFVNAARSEQEKLGAQLAAMQARIEHFEALAAEARERAAGWVYALVAAALAAAVLSSVRREAGLAITAPLLILVAATALLEKGLFRHSRG